MYLLTLVDRSLPLEKETCSKQVKLIIIGWIDVYVGWLLYRWQANHRKFFENEARFLRDFLK